jgi:lysophospholipase L1-like esterase
MDARLAADAYSRQAESQRLNLPALTSLGDLMTPNQRGMNAGVIYETNSFGFRGPERGIDKPSDVFRTMILGDSFAMGSGVTYEHIFAARLERELPQLGRKKHEVINLGVSGLSLKDSLDRYDRQGAQFHPDLLVYAYTLNDLEGRHYVRTMQCTHRREAHRGSWSHLWRRIGESWLWLREELEKPEDSYPYELDYNYFSNEPAWADFDAALGRLAAITDRLGICGLVMIQTHLRVLNRFHAYHEIYSRVAVAASKKGLFVKETFPYFDGLAAKDLWVSDADIHPNSRGHAILARALADGIASLPQRCIGD